MQTTDPAAVEVVVNGETRTVPAGAGILDLLRWLDLEPSRVAVEVDRRIIKQAEWPSSKLSAGMRLEIVQFVGGG
jgi:thiamine biosynthesis protein ThiS